MGASAGPSTSMRGAGGAWRRTSQANSSASCLSRAETMTLDFSKDAVGRELSQDEIDARFRTKEDAVLGCVARARPDEYTYVPGRVTVKFRIQRTGTVKGVQVEAPVILHRGGLTACLKRVVGGLRFPASNMSQVITYPFSLM